MPTSKRHRLLASELLLLEGELVLCLSAKLMIQMKLVVTIVVGELLLPVLKLEFLSGRRRCAVLIFQPWRMNES